MEHGLQRLRSRVREWEGLACSPFAMRALREYHWPGNVRQLLSALESGAVQASGGRIEVQHLPAEVREAVSGGIRERRYRASSDEGEEREAIRAALAQADGQVARAADLLGMGRTTLWRKMKAFGIGT